MPSGKSLPWMTLLASAAMMVLHWLAGPANEGLIYQRELSLSHELWRWITAHLVHADLPHLIWNLAGTLILGGLLQKAGFHRLVSASLFIMTSINLVIYQDPQLAQYCGFSAVLNGWLVILLGTMWQQDQQRYMVLIVATGALAKLVIELTSHQALFTDHSWRSVPMAHLAGSIAGALWMIGSTHVKQSKLNFFNGAIK